MHSSSTSGGLAPTVSDAVVPSVSGWRGRRRWPYLFGAAVVVGLLALPGGGRKWLGALFESPARELEFFVVKPTTLNITLEERGELQPNKSIKLKCEVDGQPSILYVVEESARVKKGDLLVELTSDAIREKLEAEQFALNRAIEALRSAEVDRDIQKTQNKTNIQKAEVDVEIAELDLQKYLEGDYKQREQAIKVEIQQTEMELERKRNELKENEELLEKGWITKYEVDQIRYAIDVLSLKLERSRLSLDTLKKYERKMNEMRKESALTVAIAALEEQRKRADILMAKRENEVAAKKADVEKRRERVKKYEEQLAKCKIYAPTDGIVQYPSDGWRWGSDRIAVGETVRKGQTLIELPDTSQMVVKTRIHEADRRLVHEGMPCLIEITALPDRVFTGRISKIDRFVSSENRWLNPDLKEHGAEILLDPTEVPLSPGESAKVRILIDTIENALAVPVQCVYTRGTHSFVFVDRGDGPEPVEVTLGQATPRLVEVAAGLTEGDRVLMRADAELLTKLPRAEDLDEGVGADLFKPKSPPVAKDRAAEKPDQPKEPASQPAVAEQPPPAKAHSGRTAPGGGDAADSADD